MFYFNLSQKGGNFKSRQLNLSSTSFSPLNCRFIIVVIALLNHLADYLLDPLDRELIWLVFRMIPLNLNPIFFAQLSKPSLNLYEHFLLEHPSFFYLLFYFFNHKPSNDVIRPNGEEGGILVFLYLNS